MYRIKKRLNTFSYKIYFSKKNYRHKIEKLFKSRETLIFFMVTKFSKKTYFSFSKIIFYFSKMDKNKCPKMKIRNTFGKKYLMFLYNKFPKQLKELNNKI